MTKTPKWLPDGSGIDPESLAGGTVVETVNGFSQARPSKPGPRADIVARVLHGVCCEDL